MVLFRFGLQNATALSMAAWPERARMADGLGYSTLYVPDHLHGETCAPVVARLAGT